MTCHIREQRYSFSALAMKWNFSVPSCFLNVSIVLSLRKARYEPLTCKGLRIFSLNGSEQIMICCIDSSLQCRCNCPNSLSVCYPPFLYYVFRFIQIPFLFSFPRHGRHHSIMPTNINFRANMWALKEEGCTHLLVTTACGSLREEIQPGDLVIIDQFIDR